MPRRPPSSALPNIAAPLLQWYDALALTLPWRNDRAPYRVWLSEIMLQQTRLSAVIPYYERFLQRFPTLQTLAAADLAEVLQQWEGLGYYSRARNLQRAAQVIVAQHAGAFPATAATLQTLPGIGRYTAAAIASIAFGERIAVLDGNVMRVLARLLDLPDDITQTKTQQRLWQLAEALLPATRVGDYNQALMDFGRLLCAPRQPRCVECPLGKQCHAFANGTVAQRPVKKAKAAVPTRYVVAALLRDATARVLLVQRPPDGLLGGLWMLPAATLNAEVSATQARTALRRTLRQQFGYTIKLHTELPLRTQTFTHFRLEQRTFAATLTEQIAQQITPPHHAWVAPGELAAYALGKTDRQIVNAHVIE